MTYYDEMFSRLWEGMHDKGDFDHPPITKDMLIELLEEHAEAQRKADAQFVRDFAKNYPVDIFTPNPEGELTDIQVTRESAETMRIMCPLIAQAMEDKEES